jgi:hypothetical protein
MITDPPYDAGFPYASYDSMPETEYLSGFMPVSRTALKAARQLLWILQTSGGYRA